MNVTGDMRLYNVGYKGLVYGFIEDYIRGDGEIETEWERIEWDWWIFMGTRRDNDEIEDIVWDMWYDGLIMNDITIEDWIRIVDVLINGRWY